MPNQPQAGEPRPPFPERASALTPDEERSRTRGAADFRFEPGQADVFTRALDVLNAARIPFVIAGAHALYAYTQAYRPTKDLDLLLEPRFVVPALGALERAGFRCHVEAPHWLAKALSEQVVVDLIYGMGNGLFRIDAIWHRHAREGTLAGVPVRFAPVEELIWHRLFISERHRFDGADILHLFLKQGEAIDWRRLLERTGEHWPLLLSYVSFFTYVYPQRAHLVPAWLAAELLGRLAAVLAAHEDESPPRTRGPLLSLFSFDVDTTEWGFRDARRESIAEALHDPEIAPILASRFMRQPAPPPTLKGPREPEPPRERHERRERRGPRSGNEEARG
jgi:hypothetical protein